MTIPIAQPILKTAEKNRLGEIIEQGQLADGEEVRRFESEFAEYCDADHGIATANGTTALHAALHGVGIGPGDRVLTTPFSFIATANAVRHCGATPIFADIDPVTYTLDPASVEDVIERHDGNVDAMIPVHLYGLPADLEPLLELADRYDLAVIEDAAQAHGASYRGTRVGAIGDVGCFSFYPTKNMTTGEGGMIVTDDPAIAARTRQVINHGRAENSDGGYEHIEVGYNFRMTSIAAAIGRVQLQRLPEYTRTRRTHAEHLTDALDGVPGIQVPSEPPDRRHVFHQYTIRTGIRQSLKNQLADAGIETAVYYPTPIHRQPAYSGIDNAFPIADRAAEEVLSLPVHPALTPENIETVAETARQFLTVERGGLQ